MRLRLLRVAMLASGAWLLICRALQDFAERLARQALRWAWGAEVKWLLARAEEKCKAVRRSDAL